MRGRLPSGPEYVRQLPGSALAKERVQVVLETLTGSCRVLEACARLRISEPRFEQLRKLVLLAAVERLEPRLAGRPAQVESAEQQRIQKLETQVADLERKLKLAQVREEIVLVLPRVVHSPHGNGAAVDTADDPEKKTRRRRLRPRARAPAARTVT